MTTYCILDPSGNVLTTFACAQLPPVQTGYVELSVSGGQPGQIWNGSAFVDGPTPIPQQVTAAQLMMALAEQSYYQAVLTYVGSLPAVDQVAFNRTDVFNRTDALIESLAPGVPLTSDQLDALFTTASKINP